MWWNFIVFRYPNVFILTTSNISGVIDLAFVDRADFKYYLGFPSKTCISNIFLSCLDELRRVSCFVKHCFTLSAENVCMSTITSCRGSNYLKHGRRFEATQCWNANACITELACCLEGWETVEIGGPCKLRCTAWSMAGSDAQSDGGQCASLCPCIYFFLWGCIAITLPWKENSHQCCGLPRMCNVYVHMLLPVSTFRYVLCCTSYRYCTFLPVGYSVHVCFFFFFFFSTSNIAAGRQMPVGTIVC